MDHLKMKELETLLQAVAHFGAAAQQIKTVEELGELSQALCKYMSHPEGNAESEMALFDHVAEEMADVYIMLEQLKIILNNHDRVDAWAHEKLARLASRLPDMKER